MIQTDGDSLTLYFYPSPYGLDWKTPRSLALTTLRNAASRKGRRIGHVSIEIEQRDEKILIFRDHVGMTDIDKTLQRKLLLKEKTGFGILFYNFDGSLESAAKLDPEVRARAQTGELSWVKFKISRSVSDRIKQYLDEFKAKGGSCWYGLPNRPRYGEGGGCSAFGASFLDVAGILLPEFKKHWTNEIEVSEKWIGPPVGTNPVSFYKIILGPNSKSWTFSDSPSRKIFFWEPDLMHQWVLNTHKKPQALSGQKAELKRHEKSLGILYDFQHLDAPSEPIWLSP